MSATPQPNHKPVACAHGEDVRSGVVRPFSFQSLRAFAAWLKQLKPVASKLESKYIVGANFTRPERTLQCMSGATMLQCDFDKVTSPDQRDSVSAALSLLGIAHVAFETFSGGGRFVVIIPLSRPASPAEHRATMDWLVSELGAYAVGLDQASYNPVLPRFVSPNAQAPERTVIFSDGEYLEPVAASGVENLPANVMPIPSKPAVSDAFAVYSDQASPEQQELFLLALRHNLLPEGRLSDYPTWFPVLFAAFRAWGVNSKNLTERQKEMMEVLHEWSAHHPKYDPKGIDAKLNDWLRDRGTGTRPLHIQSVITHEVDAARLRQAIKADLLIPHEMKVVLGDTLSNMLGKPAETVLPDEVIESAITKLQAQDKVAAELRARSLNFIARAPQINDRFDRFLDLLTAFATQNKAERWELGEDWDHFLRPAPILFSLCQIYSLGFAPHVMFRLSAAIEPKALNIFTLNIAEAGTGKSASMNIIHNVLSKTVFKNIAPSYKLHSATGLWMNAFERHGPLQLVTSDEAESLIGKQGQKDQHLLALQTAVKQLYDAGIPGRRFRPSAQVQRELQEITAPVMHLNLSATPTLLRDDIGSAMLNDGFISRMIVCVDDRDPGDEDEDAIVNKKIALIKSETTGTMESTIADAVKFLNESWRSVEAKHPAGKEFFSVMGDETSGELAGRIGAHFERPDLPVRYVTPPSGDAELAEFCRISARASSCWHIPQGMRGTDAEANIKSLRVRSESKLHILSAILTLVADPSAKEIDLRIMRWVSDILYTVQHPFYRHLLTTSDTGATMLKARVNPDFVSKLRPALAEGGPLRSGVVSASTLIKFSRPWRKLVSDLRQHEANERRKVAEEILDELEVKHEVRDNKHVFYLTKGLDDV